jgi:C4-dicarboxylate-specific signal transduction histidine kinase
MKIKSRINFSFVTIFILILSFVCFAVIVYASNLVVENIRSYLYLSSHSKAEHIRTFVQGQKKTAVILAAASVYRDFLEEPKNSSQYPIIKKKIDDRLARTIAADSNIDETLIIGVDGIVVASSDRNKEGVDLSQEDYFILAKDEVFVKDLYFSGTTNRLNYIISAPVKDDQDNFLGVSVLSYSPNKFFSLVKIEDGLGITEENFLVNRNRFFITPSILWGSDVILKQKSNAKNVVDCFDPDEVAYV